jgi:hypothetical protein
MKHGRHHEPYPLRIPVAGLPKRRRRDQHVESVQGSVESRVRARTHRRRVASAEHQPSSNERTSQQQQGAAGRIPVPGEEVLQPPPPSQLPGTLPPLLALLDEQDAARLLVVT